MSESTSQIIVVRRAVKQERRSEYETWLGKLQTLARTFEGYQGTDVVRPSPSENTYTSIYRFSSPETLQSFEQSSVKSELMKEVSDLVASEPDLVNASGLEVWFEAPPGTVAVQPVRWRMACLIFLTVFALVEVLSLFLSIVAPQLDPPLSTAAVTFVQVFLLTYVLLPLFTRVFAFWIFADVIAQPRRQPS